MPLILALALLCLMSLLLSPQEVPWASRTRRGNQPVGNRCQECANVLKRAWPEIEFEQAMLKKDSSKEFQEELERAIRVYRGAKADFPRQTVGQENKVGFIVERPLRFLSTTDFEELYKCKPTDLSLPVETLEIKPGKKLTGVVIQEEMPKPGIPIRAFYQANLTLETRFQTADEQLRPDQGADVLNVLDNQWKLPKQMRNWKDEQSMTVDGLQALAKEYIDKKKAEAADREATAAAAPTTGEEAGEEAANGDEGDNATEDEDEESEDEILDTTTSLSLIAAPPKAKAKGRGKGKTSTKGKFKKGAALKRLSASVVAAPSKAGTVVKQQGSPSRSGRSVVSAAQGSSSGVAVAGSCAGAVSSADKSTVKARELLAFLNI
eukprot:6459721-Amphidinium_carterae.1